MTAGTKVLTDEERDLINEAKLCALTFPASARQVVKELLEIIERLTLTK
jgi:hypothetical protein